MNEYVPQGYATPDPLRDDPPEYARAEADEDDEAAALAEWRAMFPPEYVPTWPVLDVSSPMHSPAHPSGARIPNRAYPHGRAVEYEPRT